MSGDSEPSDEFASKNQLAATRCAEPDLQKPEPFCWRVRLSDKAPGKIYVLAGVAVFAFLIGTLLFRNIALGIIGFAIILGSTAEYWLGSQFRVDEKGASVRTGLNLSAIEWPNVKRVVNDGGGIKLSPLPEAGTMDAFRGVYLRYGADNRESVERAVLTFGRLGNWDLVDRADSGGD